MFRQRLLGRLVKTAAVSWFSQSLIPFASCDDQHPPKISVLNKIHELEDELSLYRPDISKFERIDHVIFEEENFQNTVEQHAIYSSLQGKSRIEAYEIYRSKETEEIYCIIRFGDKMNGWPNIVHGGILTCRGPSLYAV